MIVFVPSRATSGFQLLSTLYGFDGAKELALFAKRIRLDRRQLQFPGDPVNEHYGIPVGKTQGALAAGASVWTVEQVGDLHRAKQAQQVANVARNEEEARKRAGSVRETRPEAEVGDKGSRFTPRRSDHARFRDLDAEGA